MRLDEKLVREGVISPNEKEIVRYGLEIIKDNIIGLSIILILGGCLGYLIESFFLWVIILPLRKNAGGYHASTRLKCILTSSGMFAFSCIVFLPMSASTNVHIVVSIIFWWIIFVEAPIESINKPLDKIEYKIYKKRTRIILLLEGALLVLALFFQWEMVLKVLTINYFIVGGSLLAGKISMRRKEITPLE